MYSRHWLAIAILAKTSGSLFITEPIGFPNFHQSWFIGLDHFYLIRDRLRPHNESLEYYREALCDRDFTMIEYSKFGSPLIYDTSFEPDPDFLHQFNGRMVLLVYLRQTSNLRDGHTEPQDFLTSQPSKFVN